MLKVNTFGRIDKALLRRNKVLLWVKTRNEDFLKCDQAVMITENRLVVPHITNTQTTQFNFIRLLIITFTRGFGVLG